MTVSVILPIYKVEPFIERCVCSLMEQTLQDVEFIFVDDASPDESVAMARRVVAAYDRKVTFLAHAANKGLPAARNTGLESACGEFIYHCDSDDWLEKDMLEKMVRSAREHDSDFVYCDFFLSFAEKERYMPQPSYTDKFEALQKGMLCGKLKHNVWNKLIKRQLYIDNGIRSPQEHCKGGEDYMIVKLLRMARKVSHVGEALYHYNRTNGNAITKKASERHFQDIKANADDVLAFLGEHPVPDPAYLAYFKLDVKLPLLMERSREQYLRWREWYPEANAFIASNPEVNFRTKAVQWMAKMGLYPLLRLYCGAVDCFYKLRYHS